MKLVAPILLGLIAFSVVLYGTRKYGAGIAPDSVSYVSAARSVAGGTGFYTQEGDPYVKWPPLYPALLAIPGVFGLDAHDASRWVNAVAFGVAIGVLAGWCAATTGSVLIGFGVGGLALMSEMLVRASVATMSEAVFYMLVALTLWRIDAMFADPRLRNVVILGWIVALASITRYAGIALVASGALAVLHASPLKTKLWRPFAFVIVASVPLVLWLLRNQFVSGTPTGERPPPATTWIENAGEIGTRVPAFLLPWRLVEQVPGWLALCLWGMPIVGSVGWAIRRARGDSVARGMMSALYVSLPLLVLVFVAATRVAMDEVGFRLLSPAFLALLAWIGCAFAAATGLPGHAKRSSFALVSLLLAALLALSVHRTGPVLQELANHGVGGYSTEDWVESPTIAELAGREVRGGIISNVPDALYMHTGHVALMSPRRTPYRSDEDVSEEELAVLRGRLLGSGVELLVWFEPNPRDYLLELEDLGQVFDLREVARFGDGTIYEVWIQP